MKTKQISYQTETAGSSAAQMIAQQMDINAQKNVRAAETRKADE
jgi:hypothetical protein